MIDIAKLKPGALITTADGRTMPVRNVYLSESGLVVTAKTAPGSIVDANVPVENIVDVKPGSGEGK